MHDYPHITTHHTSSSTSKKLRVKITHTPEQEKLLLLPTRPLWFTLLFFSCGVFFFSQFAPLSSSYHNNIQLTLYVQLALTP